MDGLLQDLGYAVAAMRRNKAFAGAALARLRLASARPQPRFPSSTACSAAAAVRDAERLVRLSEEHPGGNSPLRVPMLSNLTYGAWSEALRTLEQIAPYL